ncbi:SLC13 family permease [Schinkia azotoformans]|uniref:SLC13 family permease n=1 Tax=Schinkia azotoformans TaxID=1454 RepID=UPI002DBCF7AD|nr:SLC13 family permease [Schinkia azotoformans]MEC1716076.1 SLC13 family permease [Schinkia azotoformans]MEC1740547.1 SLC13 family permease [Schinkia azotoformans]MEC1756115.1 SLC13 family permease [Schinkia azotoformans]MEC1768848.1 SLC13 family permease [Schinkia azotoformans]MEC1788404.1 SLC13 family permease [Schinkia azotoformans]
MQLIITFLILGITIVLFMSNRIRADFVSLLALLALVLTGVLEPSEALAGFSNSVVIMIAGLFVVGAGILRTGLAQKAGNLLLHWSGNSEKKLFILLLLIVIFVGSFMSNTGTVAIMLPVVISIAISIKKDVSKFLIPLSYAASLSGLMTLIASPPNLIISQTLAEHGFERLKFFDITPIGIIAAITGILYLFLVRNILLPNGQNKKQVENNQLSPKDLIQNYHLEEILHRVQITEGSPMVDKLLSDLKIPAQYQLCILKIDRKAGEGRSLLPITYQEMAGPASVIHAKDILYIQGSRAQVEKLVNDYQLVLETEELESNHLVSSQLGVAEVLLTPYSKLINKTIREIDFREKYNLNIIGINRKGTYILKEMSNVHLRFGDALLVQGSWDEIDLLSKETKDVVVVGQPKVHASMASASGKAPIAGIILLFMVVLMILEVFPPVISVLIGAVFMIITGCLRNMDDAYGQLNWESIVLIACMLPLATALEKTGGMEYLSEGIIRLLGDYGPTGVLIGIYLVTMVFGQFISNTATAVLFAPIAMNAALGIGVSPYPFLIAVAVAASMAFATPVASPTNALVMTAGGYKFSDFVKIGIPMQIVMFIVMMLAIPMIFSF